jgi:hypothetical protein
MDQSVYVPSNAVFPMLCEACGNHHFASQVFFDGDEFGPVFSCRSAAFARAAEALKAGVQLRFQHIGRMTGSCATFGCGRVPIHAVYSDGWAFEACTPCAEAMGQWERF